MRIASFTVAILGLASATLGQVQLPDGYEIRPRLAIILFSLSASGMMPSTHLPHGMVPVTAT